ncbi:hypothetical protein [Nocardia sp. NPDC049149]|uniref:WXG100-like domain-containing protein n=1 Tax=Nocardia sp. NPDC049149 TaxID=3364315 RepID=UPI00371F9BFF
MGLELPEGLRWLGWVAGSSWPDGDETTMWEIANAWHTAGGELKALLAEIDVAKRATMDAYLSGAGRAAMGARFDQLRTGDQSVESLAELFETIGDSAFDAGTELEATKLNIIISLTWLALELLWAWVFPPTAPAAEKAAILTTRSILRVLEDRLVTQITNLAARLGAAGEKRYFFQALSLGKLVLPTAKGIGVYSVKFLETGLTSMALDGSVQLGQMAAGHRRHFDGRQLGVSAFASLAGTLPSREFARYLGFGLDKAIGKQVAGVWGGPTARGAFIGAASGVVGSAVGNVAVGVATGSWDSFGSPTGWVGGMARGGLVGGARGAASMGTIAKNDPRRFFWAAKPAVKTPVAATPSAPVGRAGTPVTADGSTAVPHTVSAPGPTSNGPQPRTHSVSSAAGDGQSVRSTPPGGSQGSATTRSSASSQSSDDRSFVTARTSDTGSQIPTRSSDSASVRSSESGSSSYVTARSDVSGPDGSTTPRGGTTPPTSWSSSVDGGLRPATPSSPGPASAVPTPTGTAAPAPSATGSAPTSSGAGRLPNSVTVPAGPVGPQAGPASPSGAAPVGGGTDAPPPQASSRAEPTAPYLGPGKDMKAKTRPKLIVDWGPMPAGFEAPAAPTAEDWLPPDHEHPPKPDPQMCDDEPDIEKER